MIRSRKRASRRRRVSRRRGSRRVRRSRFGDGFKPNKWITEFANECAEERRELTNRVPCVQNLNMLVYGDKNSCGERFRNVEQLRRYHPGTLEVLDDINDANEDQYV